MFSFLPFVLVFCFWLRYQFGKSSRTAEKSKAHMLDLERNANATRRKSIDTLHYITISEKSIPIIKINDDLIMKYQKSLLNFENKRIVNLSAMTNTELKLTYGVANLTALTEYDTNFSELVRLLHTYASRLNELGYAAEAISVLEYAVNIGTDMGTSYKLLADLYHNNAHDTKINDLISNIENVNPLVRNSVSEYLNQYL